MVMSSLFASRSVLARALRNPVNARLTPNVSCAFHSGALKSEDEKKAADVASVELAAPSEGIVSKLGLDDWKISAPVGIAVAIPALHNGVYVLNEETQLAACFMLFCTSVYKFGGDMIASYFDSRAEAILREHNEAEDANIAVAKETLEAHRHTLGLYDDISALNEAHKDAVKLLCETESLRLRHHMRDIFAKNLEAVVEAERGFTLKVQKHMIEHATNKVTEEFTTGNKGARDSAFKNALAALSDSKKSDTKSAEQDPMVSLFIKHMREYAEGLEKQEGKVVQLTPAEIEEFQAELDAYMKRYDLEAAQLKAPKEVTLELIK